MTVILGNKYQSKQRDNFRKIAGIGESNDKIEVENKKRILGQTGTAWLAGNSPASETTGDPEKNDCCNKDPKKPEPDPDPNPNPNPDNPDDPDPDDPYKCECVSVGHSNAAAYCCVSGKDCETGRPIKIQLKPTSEPIFHCPEPPEPKCTNGIVAVLRPYPYKDIDDYNFCELDGINGCFEETVQKGVEIFKSNSRPIEIISQERINEKERTINDCGETYTYTEYRIFIKYKYTDAPWGTINTGSATANVYTVRKGTDIYNKALANWNKNKPKQYFAKGGKFYNTCDPYGEPPVDCVEMCDENGNKYKVCGDGSITGID